MVSQHAVTNRYCEVRRVADFKHGFESRWATTRWRKVFRGFSRSSTTARETPENRRVYQKPPPPWHRNGTGWTWKKMSPNRPLAQVLLSDRIPLELSRD